MPIVPQQNTNEKQILSAIDKFFKDFKIGALLKQSNFCKEGGIPCLSVLKYLFRLIFTGKSLFIALDSDDKPDFCKNVVYRLLNSVRYNWHKFLLLLASAVIKERIETLTSDDRVNVFIVDDSIYERGRSKEVVPTIVWWLTRLLCFQGTSCWLWKAAITRIYALGANYSMYAAMNFKILSSLKH
jgi:hypothetical protein